MRRKRQDRDAGSDDRPHRPAGRSAARRHRPGRGADRGRARSLSRPAPTAARRADYRPPQTALPRPGSARSSASTRRHRRPRPHAGRGGQARRAGGRARRGGAERRQGQSRRAVGAKGRGGAHARRTETPMRWRPSGCAAFPSPRSPRPSTASSATRRRPTRPIRAAGNAAPRAGADWPAPMSKPISSGTQARPLIQPGQKVRRVTVDALDGSRDRRDARESSVAPAIGAQFALLPPENATGNFTRSCRAASPVRNALPADESPQKGDAAGWPARSQPAVGARSRSESLPKPTLLGAWGLDASAHGRSCRQGGADQSSDRRLP